MVKTICYLKIPDFFLQLRAIFFPEFKKGPVVIGGSADEYGIIMEVSPFLKKKGIRREMLSHHAKEIYPDIEFIPPDDEKYNEFLKKILLLLEDYSVNFIKDKYDGFFLFLPDYYSMKSVIKKIQRLLHSKWSIVSQIGLSNNKYAARLGANICPPMNILYVTKDNSHNIFENVNIEILNELCLSDIEKLKLAGISTISDLFKLDLHTLRFFMNDKGVLLYHNYINQLKTTRDIDNFFYEEVVFYKTLNHVEKIMKILNSRIKAVFRDVSKNNITIIRFKLYIEYVDNKNYIFLRKLKNKNSFKEIVVKIRVLLNKMTRRVRIKKIGLYFFYTNGIQEVWFNDKKEKLFLEI